MIRLAGIAFGLLALCSTSQAWDRHEPTLIPWVLQGLKPALRTQLMRPLGTPCSGLDQAQYNSLSGPLQLNPAVKVKPMVAGGCVAKKTITGLEILSSEWIDEPDHGMDEDLPDALGQAADPQGDRKWMGGLTGQTSKGFRHMYFGGMSLLHPIRTFQIPVHAVGRNPWRAEEVALKAREWIRQGNPWGYRLLAWAVHYVEDISQPFHAAQIPHWRMVPWFSLLSGFGALVSDTTHSMTNYHWAYEGYVRDRLIEGHGNPLEDCVAKASEHSGVKWDPSTGKVADLGLEVARLSVEQAPAVGSSLMQLFGLKLRTREVNFPKFENIPDNREIIARPDLSEARQVLHEATCPALANGVLASQLLIEWALQP